MNSFVIEENDIKNAKWIAREPLTPVITLNSPEYSYIPSKGDSGTLLTPISKVGNNVQSPMSERLFVISNSPFFIPTKISEPRMNNEGINIEEFLKMYVKDKSMTPDGYKSRTEYLSENKIRSIIEEQFQFDGVITRLELQTAFRNLGIISENQKIFDTSLMRETINKWKIEDNLYDVSFVRDAVMDAVTKKKTTEFHRYVRKQFFVFMANRLSNRKIADPEPTRFRTPQKSFKRSYNLDRLLLPKDEVDIDRPSVRKKYVPPPYPEIRMSLSSVSKSILENTEYNNKDYFERDEIRQQKQNQKINSIMKELEDANTYKKPVRNPEYELTEEERKEFEKKRRRRFEASVPNYPFKPRITAWEDYETRRANSMLEPWRLSDYERYIGKHKRVLHKFIERKRARSRRL